MKHEFCTKHQIPYCVICNAADKSLSTAIKSDSLELERLKLIEQRYEKLRKLNPRQFAELYEAHLKSGERFDDMVDNVSHNVDKCKC